MSPDSPRRSLSVVTTFYNEEAVLSELLLRLTQTLSRLGCEYEIILVNDASTDRSLDILRDHIIKDSHIRCITTSRKFGVEPCLQLGIEHATGDAVITIDADLQDPPELIPEMVEKWKAGADVVHTTRTDLKGEAWYRLGMSRLAYQIIRKLSGLDLPIEASLYKLLSRRVVDVMNTMKERTPYLRGIPVWIGFRQDQVFYERQARFAGETHFPGLGFGGLAAVKTLGSGIISFSVVPLYVSFLLGLVMSAGSALFLAAAIFLRVTGAGVPDAALWAGLIALIVSIQMTTVGIFGIYLGRMHEQLKHRPPYVIDSYLGFKIEKQTR